MNTMDLEKASLTKREKDCLRYLVYGMTAKEIGRELGISHRTVESYLSNVKAKMGCAYKSQLIAKVLKDYVEIHIRL